MGNPTNNYRVARRWLGATTLSSLIVIAACAPAPTVTSGPFRQLNLLESEVRRGVSTKLEVQRLLGVPNGFGGALLPTDTTQGNFRTFEVWFYDDIEMTGMQSEGGGIIRANMRQQILQIFFKENLFDGFFWTSNAGVVTGEQGGERK